MSSSQGRGMDAGVTKPCARFHWQCQRRKINQAQGVASPLIRELLSLPCSDSRSVSPSRLIWDVLQPWTTLPLHTDGDSGMSAPPPHQCFSFSVSPAQVPQLSPQQGSLCLVPALEPALERGCSPKAAPFPEAVRACFCLFGLAAHPPQAGVALSCKEKEADTQIPGSEPRPIGSW